MPYHFRPTSGGTEGAPEGSRGFRTAVPRNKANTVLNPEGCSRGIGTDFGGKKSNREAGNLRGGPEVAGKVSGPKVSGQGHGLNADRNTKRKPFHVMDLPSDWGGMHD